LINKEVWFASSFGKKLTFGALKFVEISKPYEITLFDGRILYFNIL